MTPSRTLIGEVKQDDYRHAIQDNIQHRLILYLPFEVAYPTNRNPPAERIKSDQ